MPTLSFALTLSLSKGERVAQHWEMPFWTYILECADGSYYVGHTDDLDARMAQHNTGIASAYTARRLPVRLLWSQDHQTRDGAYWLERQLKGWSRAKKEAAMRGDWDALPELARTSRVRARPSTSSG